MIESFMCHFFLVAVLISSYTAVDRPDVYKYPNVKQLSWVISCSQWHCL